MENKKVTFEEKKIFLGIREVLKNFLESKNFSEENFVFIDRNGWNKLNGFIFLYYTIRVKNDMGVYTDLMYSYNPSTKEVFFERFKTVI